MLDTLAYIRVGATDFPKNLSPPENPSTPHPPPATKPPALPGSQPLCLDERRQIKNRCPNGRAALWWKRDASTDTNSRVHINQGTLADVGLNFNDTGVFLAAGTTILLMASSTTTVNTAPTNGQATRLVVTKIG